MINVHTFFETLILYEYDLKVAGKYIYHISISTMRWRIQTKLKKILLQHIYRGTMVQDLARRSDTSFVTSLIH